MNIAEPATTPVPTTNTAKLAYVNLYVKTTWSYATDTAPTYKQRATIVEAAAISAQQGTYANTAHVD